MANSINQVQLRCRSCGGTLHMEGDQQYLYCPFCGEASLLVDSDTVKVERLRTSAQTEIARGQQAVQRELELKRQEKEVELEKLRQKERRWGYFLHGSLYGMSAKQRFWLLLVYIVLFIGLLLFLASRM